MKKIRNKINEIIGVNHINNAERVARRLYPKPYFLENENGSDDDPILYI